jgi:uncharacterized protein
MRTAGTRGTALVTGASSGIGAVYADRLAQRGHDLILVARNKERLALLARRLARDPGRAVEAVAADLTNAVDLQRVEHILRTNTDISLLVNNAGVGAVRPLLASDVNKMEEMIRLNVTHSLVHELTDKGVRVQAVLPGATATEFWDTVGVPVHRLPPETVMTASDVVDAALAGLDLGEIVTIPSLANNADWERYEAARRAISLAKLSRTIPAPRYKLGERGQLRS